MRKLVKIDLKPGISDQSIREEALSYPNGGYVVWVCRNCGLYITHPDASTDCATIRDFCDDCFDHAKDR